MKHTFSRNQRILNRREYREIYEQGRKYVGSKILIFYRLARAKNPRLGVTVSKKWGKAHDRNRFKRVIREGYRAFYHQLPTNLELNVHPREGYITLHPNEVEIELKNLVAICGQTQHQSETSCRNN